MGRDHLESRASGSGRGIIIIVMENAEEKPRAPSQDVVMPADEGDAVGCL